MQLRKPEDVRNREEVAKDWQQFKTTNNLLDESIIIDGKTTTINDLMSF